MRRQEEQMQPFGKLKLSAFMPACLIQNQEKVLVWPHFLFFCEDGEDQRKGLRIDGGHE